MVLPAFAWVVPAIMLRPYTLFGKAPKTILPYKLLYQLLGGGRVSDALNVDPKRTLHPELSSGGEAAHQFLFAGEEIAQAGAGGIGFDAALDFGEFLLGLALLKRFDAA